MDSLYNQIGDFEFFQYSDKESFIVCKSKELEEIVAYSNENKVENFLISWYNDFEGESLNFLHNIANVKKIIINPYQIMDISALNSLHNLVFLRINSNPVKQIIDFKNFQKLECFEGYWNNFIRNFFDCGTLKKVQIWNYSSFSKDLSEFRKLNSIEHLDIYKSDITSLNGLENLKNLKILKLAYNRNLVLFENGDKNYFELKELHIEVCKKLDMMSLRGVKKLESLYLENNGKYDTLKPILKKLPALKYLSFSQTDLTDGDLSYLLEQPKLEEVYFLDKKHYLFTCEEINEALQDDKKRKLLLARKKKK